MKKSYTSVHWQSILDCGDSEELDDCDDFFRRIAMWRSLVGNFGVFRIMTGCTWIPASGTSALMPGSVLARRRRCVLWAFHNFSSKSSMRRILIRLHWAQGNLLLKIHFQNTRLQLENTIWSAMYHANSKHFWLTRQLVDSSCYLPGVENQTSNDCTWHKIQNTHRLRDGSWNSSDLSANIAGW